MVGAGGPIKKGIFAKILEVTPEHVILEGGLKLSKDAACSHAQLQRRPSAEPHPLVARCGGGSNRR
jgi:hypothetical protein